MCAARDDSTHGINSRELGWIYAVSDASCDDAGPYPKPQNLGNGNCRSRSHFPRLPPSLGNDIVRVLRLIGDGIVGGVLYVVYSTHNTNFSRCLA